MKCRLDISPLVSRLATVVAAVALSGAFGANAQTAPLPTWVQQSPATSPPARDGAAMAADSKGNLMLFGGMNPFGYLNDTWTWNGTGWTQQSPVHSPPARGFAAMAYQPGTGQTVLFGGSDGGPLGDTWTWNGTDWAQQSPATTPGARTQTSLASSSNGLLVLFGGYSSNLLTDTWTWDGTNWTEQSPASHPGARYAASMAYSASAKQTVLFGGGLTNGSFLNDTWVWDGTNWTEETPITSPSARVFLEMAYSSNSGEIVLFGGQGTTGKLNDTWSWNGTNWTQLSPVANPGVRSATSIAATADDVVVFGGTTPLSVTPLDDTWTLQLSPNAQDTTTPVLTSSPNPSTVGQAVILTATVTGTAAAPTGPVSFLDGTSTIGTTALTPGSGLSSTASITTSSLAAGNHSITASYTAASGGAAHADTFAWTKWTLATPGNATAGTAAGTLASTLYGTIDVTYSGQTSGLVTQPSWSPATTFSGGIVGNAPPANNGLALEGGYPYNETITFSHPVTDPAFAIWSLGSPSVAAYFNFTAAEPFNLLGGGPNKEYGGKSIVIAGTAIDGSEGNGVVQFIGNYSSLTFTTPDYEDYYALTVGEDQTLTDNPPISNVVDQVVNQGTAAFGAMTFSPAATEPYGTSQIVTIGDTVTYSGVQPTGAVTYVLNGVSYQATCATAGNPETCSAAVPAATIAALPVSGYVVTGGLASDGNYSAATAVSGEFTVTPAGACTVPNPGAGTMNITYFTIAESDRDADSLPGGVDPNYVLTALGANGLPVSNVAIAAGGPGDVLGDGEITWWSPALNNGGAGGASDVVQTGVGVVSLPYTNNDFYPPNGVGQNDFNGFQAAILSSTLNVPAAETISFSVSSDDMAFVYLDGQIACDDGGIHAAGSVPCTTSVISAGAHSLELFFVDLKQVGAVLGFSVTTSNVSVGTADHVAFGTMTFSPVATEPFGTSQAITIGDTLTYTGPPPTGVVAFVLNGVSYTATCTGSSSPETCSATVPAATIAALVPNTYSVSGSFAGDCNYAMSNAANGTFVITVNPGVTNLALAASATTLTFGQTLTLTATATGAITGHAPTGTVAFTSGGAALGTSALNGSSIATYSYAPAIGTYLLDATYGGDTFNDAAKAPALSVTVVPAPTTLTLTSNSNPAPVGSLITFTISVQSGAGVPPGQVTLMDGATLLSQMTLNAGTATYSTSTLTIGTHSLTAFYAATVDYAASQATLSQIVLNPPNFSIAASGPLTLVTEHHGPITITVTPLNLFSGNVVLSCGALPPLATCEWGTSELTSTTVMVPNAPSSTQLVIDTSAVLGYESSAGYARPGGGWFPPAGMALSMMWLWFRRRKRVSGPLICLLLFAGLSGCAGKYPASTPPGTYTIDILGSSGTLHNAGKLTLVVTANPNGEANIR